MRHFFNDLDCKAGNLQEMLLFIMQANAVRRWHTEDVIKEHTIGAHSATVAWLCYFLAETISINLVMAALAHDLPERVLGDMPGNTKQDKGFSNKFEEMEIDILVSNEINFAETLSKADEATLSVADKLAGMLECIRERALGNMQIVAPYRCFLSKASDLAQTAKHRIAICAVHNLWEEANA